MNRRFIANSTAFLVLAVTNAPAQECDKQFDSTYDLIQEVIFEAKGCTSSNCHSGTNPAAELDLTAGNSYEQLIDQPVRSVATRSNPSLKRLVPISKTNSLLWLNLASAILPDEWQAPLRPMPIGGFEPLTFDELELVRLWIEYGATRDGVVPGSGELVDACTGPPGMLEVEPLPTPAPGTGVQLRAPRQVLPPESERESCFVSYYNIADQVPAESLSGDGKSFRFKRVEPRQDPLSHHAVVIVYTGQTPIDSPVWGEFQCRGGEKNGEPCAPRDTTFCGDQGVCGSPPRNAVACTGFGPGDAGIGVGDKSLFNTMASSVAESSGIYDEAPTEGILVWNSHAFNVSAEPAKLDIWVNIYFANADEQKHRLQRFVNISRIFSMRPPAFGADQVCGHHVVPQRAQLLDLASHTHKRGKRFRIFEGRFSCNGGPNEGDACTPFGAEPGFPLEDLCAGFPCESRHTPRVGDCDGDLRVGIGELTTGVGIALGRRPLSDCRRFDGDIDNRVSIGELITAVHAALAPEMRDAEESLVYSNLSYADPLVKQYIPARYLAAPGASAEERTLTYCALYDNGFTDPEEVKRRSTSPENSSCRVTHCAEGRVGQPCSNATQCDTAPGAGDGACDACSAGFGVTTDDEMFVLTGSFYVP